MDMEAGAEVEGEVEEAGEETELLASAQLGRGGVRTIARGWPGQPRR